MPSIRCDAHQSHLDDYEAHLRTHEKTATLFSGTWTNGEIWDYYGLRSDVVVSQCPFFCLIQLSECIIAIHL
jgi:hypothetical protein